MSKLKWLVGFALLATLLWYFFLKQEHYQIRFITSQPPGVVYQHLADWPIFGKQDSLEVVWEGGSRFSTVHQMVIDREDTLDYQWDIWRINDSTTKVKAKVTDPKHYWKRKWEVPLQIGNFASQNVTLVENVRNQLNKKAENFEVEAIADTIFPSKFCAYISVENVPVAQKANKMLSEISLVMGYIKDYEIPLDGDPFLQVTRWDQENNTIDFDFCFPIQKSDSLPPTQGVAFKTTNNERFLKAVFHGNYRISDHAWYYLLDYANRNDLQIEALPTELYLNDPHVGGNSLEWEAHIFVPLK